jgi:hypothetical protein
LKSSELPVYIKVNNFYRKLSPIKMKSSRNETLMR